MNERLLELMTEKRLWVVRCESGRKRMCFKSMFALLKFWLTYKTNRARVDLKTKHTFSKVVRHAGRDSVTTDRSCKQLYK